MIIKSFRAENFRNIKKCSLSFGEGVNLLIGENAQGKTNAIEGIYMFARGKSFRKNEDKELIKFGTEGFRISIEYEDKNGINTLEYALFGKEKRRKKNGYRIEKIADMIGNFKAVLFFPDDLSLIKGGPEERRAFLNVAITQCYISYMNAYSGYKKALENRNYLLKMASKGMLVDENEVYAWSLSMAEYASYIYLKRRDYIKRLEYYAKDIMKDISDGKEEISFIFESNIKEDNENNLTREEVRKIYERILTENISREMAAGVSLFGPHRDDVDIRINGVSSRSFASQGQQRTIVLSMKLAEGEVNREICGEYPVYLFDDVLSELDDKRQSYVLSGKLGKQIIITSCEKEKGKNIKNLIEVKGGYYN